MLKWASMRPAPSPPSCSRCPPSRSPRFPGCTTRAGSLAPPGMMPPESDRTSHRNRSPPSQPCGGARVLCRARPGRRMVAIREASIRGRAAVGKLDLLQARELLRRRRQRRSRPRWRASRSRPTLSALLGAIASVGGGVKLVVAHSQTVALAATASYHRIGSDACYNCSSSDDALWAIGGVVGACLRRQLLVVALGRRRRDGRGGRRRQGIRAT